MVTGNGLTTERVDRTLPVTMDCGTGEIPGHKVGLPVRVIVKLFGVIESHAPVGYEDKGGFHYGANLAGGFFSI